MAPVYLQGKEDFLMFAIVFGYNKSLGVYFQTTAKLSYKLYEV